MTTNRFSDRLSALGKNGGLDAYKQGALRGVERELLRIDKQGNLCQTPHPASLGSTLCHPALTTDFSEAQPELVTSPQASIPALISEMSELHAILEAALDAQDERIWPLSMPLKTGAIPLAEYGTSHAGLIKQLYRKGLEHRYGSVMQAICGVHYNFSLPRPFWEAWRGAADVNADGRALCEAGYMTMARNFNRHHWLLIWLTGASPVSSLPSTSDDFPLEQTSAGDWTCEGAISLRNSGIGYSAFSQPGLHACCDSLESYTQDLQRYLTEPWEPYRHFQNNDGEAQLSNGRLQIENELYAPIRMKQDGDNLLMALREKSIGWVEVRILDCDPYAIAGLASSSCYLMELFLLWCAISETADNETSADLEEAVQNARNAACFGGNEETLISLNGNPVPIRDAALEIGAQLQQLAECLGGPWRDALTQFAEVNAIPATKIKKQMRASGKSYLDFGLDLSERLRQQCHDWSDSHSVAEVAFAIAGSIAQKSKADQQAAEARDASTDFKDYLADWRQKRGLSI